MLSLVGDSVSHADVMNEITESFKGRGGGEENDDAEVFEIDEEEDTEE